jgi:hypothetical protein
MHTLIFCHREWHNTVDFAAGAAEVQKIHQTKNGKKIHIDLFCSKYFVANSEIYIWRKSVWFGISLFGGFMAMRKKSSTRTWARRP